MPVFPGETGPTIIRDILPEDAGYVTHRLESNMHTGTHIDAPFHSKSDTLTIDKYPAELFAGEAVLIDVKGMLKVVMQPEWIHIFNKYKIVLFYTGYSKQWFIYKVPSLCFPTLRHVISWQQFYLFYQPEQ